MNVEAQEETERNSVLNLEDKNFRDGIFKKLPSKMPENLFEDTNENIEKAK